MPRGCEATGSPTRRGEAGGSAGASRRGFLSARRPMGKSKRFRGCGATGKPYAARGGRRQRRRLPAGSLVRIDQRVSPKKAPCLRGDGKAPTRRVGRRQRRRRRRLLGARRPMVKSKSLRGCEGDGKAPMRRVDRRQRRRRWGLLSARRPMGKSKGCPVARGDGKAPTRRGEAGGSAAASRRAPSSGFNGLLDALRTLEKVDVGLQKDRWCSRALRVGICRGMECRQSRCRPTGTSHLSPFGSVRGLLSFVQGGCILSS